MAGGGLPPFASERQRSSSGLVVREVVVLAVVAIAVAFAMKATVAQAFYIPSPSMVPQLQVRDKIVVSKLSYHLHDPRRGDIVVFDCPPEVSTCKRARHRFLPLRLVHDLG